MKQFALVCLGAITLLGCDDSPPAEPSQPATQETGNPITGVWENPDRILVLEANGDLYLPADPQRQGLSWQQQADQFTLQYLDSDALSVEQLSLQGQQQGDALSLTAPAAATRDSDEPQHSNAALLAGDYTRNNAAIGHLSGQAQLPADSHWPDTSMLAVSLFSGSELLSRRIIPLGASDHSPAFRLYFPADTLTADGAYQLLGQILADDGILFRSEPVTVTYNPDQPMDIPLPMSPVMSASETLHGTLGWRGGNPVFTPCNSDRRLQLSGPMKADLVDELQNTADYPQQPRQATLSGIVGKIPGQQKGSTQAAVAVESYLFEDSNSQCDLPTATLINTRWQLIFLADSAVTAGANTTAPHLLLTEQGEIRGHGGCNRFQGSYSESGQQWSLSSLSSTEMACPGLETEQQFFQALNNSQHYRIDGELLTLFDDNHNPLASFQAEHL